MSATLAVGLDLGGTKLAGGVVAVGDAGVEVLARRRVPTPHHPDAVVAAIIEMTSGLRADVGPSDVSCAGLGVAGHLDLDGVAVMAANTPMVVGVDLAGRVLDAGGIRPVVDNDANMVALSAHRLLAPASRSLVAVTFGTGIGGGLVLDGRVFRGGSGLAGEPGHMVVAAEGPTCRCGQRGCWEAVASGRALDAAASGRGLSGGSEVVALLAEGDADAEAAWSDWTRWVAIGVANLVQLLDPDVVVLGGGVSEAAGRLVAAVEGHLATMSVGLDVRDLRLLVAPDGPDAGIIGAAIAAANAAGRDQPVRGSQPRARRTPSSQRP